MSDWYLCQTKVRDEYRAKINLERQGYFTNLPLLDNQPLFPGYIFVRVDDKPFAPINNTRGVLHLVKFGENLAIVPDSLIGSLQETEWARSDECAPGTEVVVNSGPFNHIRAIVKAKKHDRIIVLMTILNSEQELSFPLKDVQAA